MLRRVGALRSLSTTAAAASGRGVASRGTHLDDALRLVRACASARFAESIDLAIRLNVDTKRSDERVRGTVLLPHGTGRTVRVAVFARGDLADAARAAGADIVGAEDLVDEVIKGRLDFSRCLATPDMMPTLAKAARALGPKGLMPNPKRGTVVTDVAEAIARAKGGEIEFRAQKEGLVHAAIGRVHFPPEHLRENALQLLCSPPRTCPPALLPPSHPPARTLPPAQPHPLYPTPSYPIPLPRRVRRCRAQAGSGVLGAVSWHALAHGRRVPCPAQGRRARGPAATLSRQATALHSPLLHDGSGRGGGPPAMVGYGDFRPRAPVLSIRGVRPRAES